MDYLKKIGFKHLVLFFLVSIPIFGYLDTLPIRLWDESRQAINAIEMYEKGNIWVTYYDDAPDMWNTKPPLLVWLQVSLMQILGINELSIRLPSALAAFLTCLTLFMFSHFYLKKIWLGCITIIVLVATQGYIDEHVVRTGDYDALLTLFSTLMGICAFLFVDSNKNKYIYLFFFTTTLAVMTKGIAGTLFLPGIFLYVLSQKHFVSTVTNKHFYLSVSIFLSLILGFYLLREQLNPGYLQAVWENELGGRFNTINEGHSGNPTFYIKDILSNDLLFIFSALIPVGCFLGLKHKNDRLRKLYLLITLLCSSFLIIISISQTKLKWYEAPIYPWLAFLISLPIAHDFNRLERYYSTNKKLWNKLLPYGFLLFVIAIPYARSLKRIYKPKEFEWTEEMYETSYYLKKALDAKIDLNNQYLVIEPENYKPYELFYIKKLQLENTDIRTIEPSEIAAGQTVFSSEIKTKNFIKKNYLYSVVNTSGNITTFKINGKK